jgi:aryl-alcohol dehydrogenase-like predicted oxidoreductase
LKQIGDTDLRVFDICLGGNVFGWTAGTTESFEVLDAYAAAGGNFIDTADNYTWWVEGNSGGESEDIIGRWMASRGNRDQLVVATKVGHADGGRNLSAATIRNGIEASLRRLRTDYVDLYYAHVFDDDTPLEETVGTLDALVRDGKVRHIGASNYSAAQLRDALTVSEREGFVPYVALASHYNFIHRREFEGDLVDVCLEHGVSCVPYFALAQGVLTGKYLSGSMSTGSGRREYARAYLDEQELADGGTAALDALQEISRRHETSIAAVAIAWLGSRAAVASPIASARTQQQLADWLPAVTLRLSDSDLQLLELI